jgi:hypothetical protein
MLFKEQWQRSFQTKLDSFFRPALLHTKQAQLLSLLLMNKCMYCIIFFQFLNKGPTVTFFILIFCKLILRYLITR